MLRCFIVDDSPRFLAAARGVLEREDVVVVGVAATGDEALRQVGELRPDVTLVDIDLGGQSGFDVVRRLHAAGVPSSRLVLISTHDEEDYAELIVDSPIAGFVPKAELSASAIHNLLGQEDDGQVSVRRGT